MKKLIIANWKAFATPEHLTAFNSTPPHIPANIRLIVCPPSVLITELKHPFKGAQDCSIYDQGAHTGENTAALLKNIGITHCIIGHSERRHQCHETDAILAQKLTQLIKNEITPIFCIGEKKDDHANGHTNRVLAQQLMILSGLKIKKIIIAYEPIWSIGTDQIPTPDHIADTASLILEELSYLQLKPQIIYGGSVSKANINGIINIPAIDGVLIGRASCHVSDLTEMMAAIQA